MTSVMTAMLRTVFPAAGCGGAAAAGVGAAAAADGEARGALEEAAIWRRGMRERTRDGGAALSTIKRVGYGRTVGSG